MNFPRMRPLLSWMACAALLLGLLVPALARVIGGAGLVEVCTVSATKWIAADGTPAPSEPGHAALGHCPLCGLGAGVAALAAPPDLAAGLLPLDFALPCLFLRSARTLLAWSAPQARAPPA